MATYTLAGTGIQLLTAGVTQLFVAISMTSGDVQERGGNPPELLKVGSFRAGVGEYFFPLIYLDATQQVIDLPSGTDRIGYEVLGGGVLLVSEGSPPATGGVTLSTSIDGMTVPDGTALTITWSGNTGGTPHDWLTIAQAGVPITQVPSTGNCLGGIGGWIYPDDCSGVAGGVVLVPSGSCTLSVNLGSNPPGDYGAFLLADDSSTVIAAGVGFTVT